METDVWTGCAALSPLEKGSETQNERCEAQRLGPEPLVLQLPLETEWMGQREPWGPEGPLLLPELTEMVVPEGQGGIGVV